MNRLPDPLAIGADAARPTLLEIQEALGGEYDIKGELGKGSVSRVFLARNRDLGRLVAIKVLLPEHAKDETSRRRFEREAKASASLSHPNVVDVYRFGRLPDETPYLVMRFVKGRTIEERLAAEGPLGEVETRRILRDVALGLAAAHSRGIVHRDVRPGNILWDEERGEALLSDFGIAAILATSGEDVTRLTMAGQIMGDPRYQSPEQLLDEDVTELADVFAFGVSGYELLSGKGPWEAKGNAQLIAARLQKEPRRLDALRPGIDPTLADLLFRCLAREPRHRPRAADLAKALAPLEAAGGTSSREHPTAEAGSGDIREVMKRRVPQIVLITLGVAWGLMTLMDQLVDRDVLPDVFYRLTLPFALAGVAASTVIAWFHGEKGKQKAPAIEYVILGVIGLIWLVLSAWTVLSMR